MMDHTYFMQTTLCHKGDSDLVKPLGYWDGREGGAKASTFCGRLIHSQADDVEAGKVKRGNSDRILTPGVILIPECRASFIKVTKLKTAMRTYSRPTDLYGNQ